MEKKSEEEESVLLIKLQVLLKKKSKSKVRDAAKNSEKLFFSEIMPNMYINSIYWLRRKKRAPIALMGPKWLQNVDLKIFRALYRTSGIV